VLPNPNWEPSVSAEPLICLSVALNVAFQFCLPPIAVVFWEGRVLRALMPKAAVHEYGDAGRDKEDVYLSAKARNRLPVQPKPKASTMKSRANCKFRLGVPRPLLAHAASREVVCVESFPHRFIG